MEHLLNNCHYSQQIWDWGAQAMRRSQRNRDSIQDTLVNWETISFHNPILQHIWQLLPGFTLWSIWKERNKRIFRSQSSPPTVTWETIRSFIKEIVRSKSWTAEDLQCSPEEQGILQNWQPIFNKQLGAKPPQTTPTSPTNWTPPPERFIKVNFDGASKGNPGST